MYACSHQFLYACYSKVNPSDCVDMDCDGLKKGLVVDEDGTFLGKCPDYV